MEADWTKKNGKSIMLINIKSLILLIVAFLNLSLGLLVFFKNRKDKINFYYAFTALSTAGWAFGLALFYLTKNPTDIIVYRFVYIFAALIGTSFLAFSFIFPYPKIKIRGIYKFLFLVLTGFIVITSIWPGALIQRIDARPLEKWIDYNEFLLYIYTFYFTLCMIGAFGNFILKYKNADSEQKAQIKYVFVGTLSAAIWGTIFNLFLPLLKYYRLMWLGPYFTVVMVGLIAYAILKYHLMNIRVILTDFLVGLMGVILLMLPFLMPTNLLKILTAGIFVLFCFFGYYLIKATYREARQKEEAQKRAAHEAAQKEEALWSAKVLKEFNQELERKVKERTQELENARDVAEEKAREAEKNRKELEKFYNLTVGRELKMAELKERVNELEEKIVE